MSSSEKRGWFVGIAEHVGHAMTFKILTDDTRKVICWSNVWSALNSKAKNLCIDLLGDEKPPLIIKSHHDPDDEETKKKMANAKTSYTIGAGNNAPLCGATYLKVLLSKAEVDTRATASHIRKNLTKLNEYMRHVAKDNIEEFNEYVRDQVTSLTSRGETTTDLLTNLFEGYLACQDKKFIEYIEKLKDGYEERTNEQVTKLEDGNFYLSQPQLIDSIHPLGASRRRWKSKAQCTDQGHARENNYPNRS